MNPPSDTSASSDPDHFAAPRPRGAASPAESLIRPGADWQEDDESYGDIGYATAGGIAKLTIQRPEVRNAFRPQTLFELADALNRARDDDRIGAVILCGSGDLAFCSGGDQRIRGDDGYLGDDEVARKGIGRLNVLDLQVQIRRTPKPVVAMVAGYAIGGGHVLHIVCDLTIAADNAVFGQTGPRVGSFDGGYGSGLLARHVGQKKAREIWYLCRQYGATEALDMGLVNTVVPLEDLGGRDGALVPAHARALTAGAAHAEGGHERRRRRPRRHPATGRRRNAALLPDPRGAARPGQLRQPDAPRLQPVPPPSLTRSGRPAPRSVDLDAHFAVVTGDQADVVPGPQALEGARIPERHRLQRVAHGPLAGGE